VLYSSRLPRYIDSEGKVKVIEAAFAEKGKSYAHLFASRVIDALQQIKVQNTVASLFHTGSNIVRSIMESAVSKALDARGDVYSKGIILRIKIKDLSLRHEI
jgi:hypothetical protein